MILFKFFFEEIKRNSVLFGCHALKKPVRGGDGLRLVVVFCARSEPGTTAVEVSPTYSEITKMCWSELHFSSGAYTPLPPAGRAMKRPGSCARIR